MIFALCSVVVSLCISTNVLALHRNDLSPPPPTNVRIDHQYYDTTPDLTVFTSTPLFTYSIPVTSLTDRYTSQSLVSYSLHARHCRESCTKHQQTIVTAVGQIQHNSPLLSDTHYDLIIQYALADGNLSAPFSGVFRTSLFAPTDWSTNATWIASRTIAMTEMRKVFSITDASRLAYATVFMSGLGYSELHVNGQQIDPSRVLDPGWTTYHRRVLYVSHNVTSYLTGGANCIGIRLGSGWYSDEQGLYPLNQGLPAQVHSYAPPRLLFQLNLHWANNSITTIVSDNSWSGRAGAVILDSVYQGSITDRRLLRADWSTAAFSDPLSIWINAETLPSPLDSDGILAPQMMPPIRQGEANIHIKTSAAQTGHDGHIIGVSGGSITQSTYAPRGPNLWANGFVYDLGQNIAGVCSLNVTGRRGRSVQIRYSESLMQPAPLAEKRNGNIDTSDYHVIPVADIFLFNLSDGTKEYLLPKFTYHGYRFIQIMGLPTFEAGLVEPSDIQCYTIHSETTIIGNFTSSSTIINQIYHNLQFSQLSNSMSLMTDCPQRNERRGWMGDAAISVDFSLFTFDYYGLYANYLNLIRDEQHADGGIPITVPWTCCNSVGDPSWSNAYSQIAWALYDHYGDITVLQEHYDGITQWVAWLIKSYQSTGLAHFYYQTADWFSYPAGQSNGSLVSSFAFMRDCHTLMEMSVVLNKTDRVAYYQTLYKQLVTEFNDVFYIDGQYSNNAQTANALALMLPGVVTGDRRSIVGKAIVDNIAALGYLSSGVVGAAQVLPALSTSGYHDEAVAAVTATTYPSYGWTFNNPYENATTQWESINAAIDQGVSSHNHHMFSGIGSWFYRFLAGISLNGLDQITIHPHLTNDISLSQAIRAELLTVRGMIAVKLDRDVVDRSTQRVRYEVTVPTVATLRLSPAPASATMMELTETNVVMYRRTSHHQQTLSNFSSSSPSLLRKVIGVDNITVNEHNGIWTLQLLSGFYQFDVLWTTKKGSEIPLRPSLF